MAGASEAVRTPAEAAAAATQVAAASRQSLVILTHALEPAIYDQSALAAEIKRLILDQADPAEPTLCRILVAEPRLVVGGRHRLLALAQRLTSRLQVRRLAADANPGSEGFIVGDARHVMRLRPVTGARGEVAMQVPHTARRLVQHFDSLWHSATEDTELRRLHL